MPLPSESTQAKSPSIVATTSSVVTTGPVNVGAVRVFGRAEVQRVLEVAGARSNGLGVNERQAVVVHVDDAVQLLVFVSANWLFTKMLVALRRRVDELRGDGRFA